MEQPFLPASAPEEPHQGPQPIVTPVVCCHHRETAMFSSCHSSTPTEGGVTRQEVLLVTYLYLGGPSPGLSWWHLTHFRSFPSVLTCHGDMWELAPCCAPVLNELGTEFQYPHSSPHLCRAGASPSMSRSLGLHLSGGNALSISPGFTVSCSLAHLGESPAANFPPFSLEQPATHVSATFPK